MTHHQNNRFGIHLQVSDFWKAKGDDGATKMRVGGIATTEGLDREDERILQDGLNFKPFLEYGFFNDDHKPGSMLGWPETAKLVKRGDVLPSGRKAEGKGWWVDGYLLDTPRGREVWANAKALVAQKAPRRMGMSVEGKIQRRIGTTIAKADVCEVAITKKPVNSRTHLEPLAKAMDAGHTDPANDPEAASGAPLRRESLEGAPKVKVKNCKTKADWMKAMAASGLEKADFVKRLSKMEGAYDEAYKKAMAEDDYEEEDDKASKSFELELLEADILTLEEELAKSSGPLDTLDSDVFDSEEIRSLEQVDVSGLIKGMTDGNRQLARVSAAGNEALRQMIGVQGKLMTRLAKSLIDSRHGQELLMGEVSSLTAQLDDLKKSITELGNSPAMRRGAGTKPEAEALARFAKGEGATGVPDGYLSVNNPLDISRAFEKSMAAAEQLENHSLMSKLSTAAIQWNQAKNRGAQVIPCEMADLINYQPPSQA
jgi:hypothetical protein